MFAEQRRALDRDGIRRQPDGVADREVGAARRMLDLAMVPLARRPSSSAISFMERDRSARNVVGVEDVHRLETCRASSSTLRCA